MRLPLRFLSLLLLGLGLLAGRPAWASHIVGGDITYRSLGGNQYEVTVTFARECSGIVIPDTLTLAYSNTCNGVPSTANLLPLGGPVVTLPQYCPAVLASFVCSTTSPVPGFQYQSYQGTVTLPPGQWTLGISDSSRPNMANLANQTYLRFEATLDNTNGLQNTSPTFNHSSQFLLPWHRRSTVQLAAFDADGDSLAYSLDSPLLDCGVPNIYKRYPGPACQSGTQAGCTYTCASTTSSSYTATQPIFVLNDTIGTCPNKTLVPRFAFSSATGSIEVEPAVYINSPPVLGDNKYAVIVKVTEYRRINGTYVRVGSVRRDLMFTVYDPGSNQLPHMGNTVTIPQASPGPIITQPLEQEIAVTPGTTVAVDLTATDADANQTLTFTLDNNVVPGMQISNTGPGTAQLTFTAPVALPPGLYHVSVNVEDDACPVKGTEVRTLAFRVMASGTLATRSSRTLGIAAWPTPFTDAVQFQLPQAGAQALTICDQLGRVVARLHSQADGLVRWQPGAEVPAGLYLARTPAGQTVRLLRSASK